MKTVKVDRKKLLETLIQNKQIHEQEFLALYGAWRTEYITLLTRELDKVRGSTPADKLGHIHLEPPTSYANDYETAIQMLQWSEEETITLDRTEFQWYVLDKWHWRDSFECSKVFYTQKQLR